MVSPFIILPSKAVNIHIVLRWTARYQKIKVYWYNTGTSTHNLDPVKCPSIDGRGSYHTLYKCYHNVKNITVLMERKSCTKHVHIFFKSYNWTVLGAYKTKPVTCRPLFFPTTPQLRGLFQTWTNTIKILSPIKTHMFSKFPPNINVSYKQGW